MSGESKKLIAIARELCAQVDVLKFKPPVTHVYNPLDYAWAAHELYLQNYGGTQKRVIFLGMNPGPFGMAQTEAALIGAYEVFASTQQMFPEAMAGLDVLVTPSAPGEAPAGLEWTGDPGFNLIWTSLHVPCVTVPVLNGQPRAKARGQHDTDGTGQ